MFTQKNLITLCFATVFTLGLAACGGGGGDAPAPSMMDDGDGSLEGKYIPSGTTIEGVDVSDVTLTAAGGESVTLPGLGTVECASDDGCSGTVAGGVLTITGDLKIVSVDPALDSETATVLAGLAVDMLPTEPEPTELEKAQAAAAQAATDAMTAAGNAKTAADNADTARADAATLQTGETSEGLAEKAREQADAAQTAYMDAKTASDAAAAADDLSDAIMAQITAQNARDAAQTAETNAGDYARMAADAAGGELMIDGTMKSVGDTTVDAEAANQVVTTTIGGKTRVADTGLQDELMEEMTGAVAGVEFAAAVAPAADTPYVQQVEARDITIGKTVDSADDTARLAIITSYAGSKTVRVFAYDEADPEVTSTADGRTGTVMGKVTLDDGDNETTDTNNTSLRSVGMFYLAGAVTESNGLAATDEVASGAEPTTVYSYVDLGDDNERGGTGGDADATVYLVSDSQQTDGGTTTYVYRSVDVTADASDATVDGTPEEVQVTAKIPDATDYEHIHFGVWASLNEDGTSPGGIGIGIGFVQNYAGAPIEASDMPNHGDATYDGNWVATIQAVDEDGDGAVSLEDGVASMEADFEKMTVEAELMGLATLSGDISGNTFSGTKVSDIEHGNLSSDADDFTGSTSGGFFGTRAAEAGGVFSFTSDGNEDGAFSGAFGGVR